MSQSAILILMNRYLVLSIFTPMILLQGNIERYQKAGLHEQAAVLIKSEYEKNQDPGLKKKLIESLFSLGRFDEILKIYDQNIPEELFYGALSLKKIGRDSRAIDQFSLYLTFDKPLHESEARLELAELYLMNRDWEKASALVMKLSSEDKDKLYAHVHDRIAILIHEDKEEEALEIIRSRVFDTELGFFEGALLYKKGLYKEAEEKFASLKASPENLFWRAKALDKQGLNSQDVREQLLALPRSPYHAETAFLFYSPEDYAMGSKKALKHLNEFIDLYPESEFTLPALYYLALNLKKDRRSETGRWLQHKNPGEALEKLELLESRYEKLKPLPAYYSDLYEQAKLERALTLLQISEESQGSKKHIHLSYAIDLLDSLPHNEKAVQLKGEAYLQDGQVEEAYKLFKDLGSKTGSAFAYFRLGQVEMERKHFLAALEFFKLAKNSPSYCKLASDQKLALQIEESLAFKEENDYESSMLILADVINSDVVSSLRVKAMYLRALLYEDQGKRELAGRQLQATSSKGGEWAQKAKDKWEKEYAR